MAVDVLQAKIRKLKNPTMVCICPTIRELPLHIKEDARHQYGQTLRAAAEAYKTFSFGILDALKDTVPAVSVISGAFCGKFFFGKRTLSFYLKLILARTRVVLKKIGYVVILIQRFIFAAGVTCR